MRSSSETEALQVALDVLADDSDQEMLVWAWSIVEAAMGVTAPVLRRSRHRPESVSVSSTGKRDAAVSTTTSAEAVLWWTLSQRLPLSGSSTGLGMRPYSG